MLKAAEFLPVIRRLLIARPSRRGKIAAACLRTYACYSSRSPVKFSSNWKMLTKLR
jgi:hypothetical protein